MNLWKHLWAHKRQPFYAFCEWYVFGRDANWEDAPAPAEVYPTTRACSCMRISGPLTSASCGRHGPTKVYR